MKPDREQEQIKALFCELRREDERRAPAFGQVLQAAAGRKRTAIPLAAWGIAAAAVLLLAAGGAVLFGLAPWGQPDVSRPPSVAQSHDPETPQASELWISRWESPTAFLLKPPAPSSS